MDHHLELRRLLDIQNKINKFFYPKKRLHFMTLKGMPGCNTRAQTIGYINDILKKLSKHYYIVREKNKVSKGYHFHALYVQDRERKVARKAVRIHIQSLGNVSTPRIPVPALNLKEKWEELESHSEYNDRLNLLIDRTIEEGKVKALKLRRTYRNEGHINRVIAYMEKELDKDLSREYVDYIKSPSLKHYVGRQSSLT